MGTRAQGSCLGCFLRLLGFKLHPRLARLPFAALRLHAEELPQTRSLCPKPRGRMGIGPKETNLANDEEQQQLRMAGKGEHEK